MHEEYFEKRYSETSINSAAQQVHNHEVLPSTSLIVVEEHEAPPIVTTSKEQTSLMNSIKKTLQILMEYVRKVNEAVSEDDHFTRGPWLSAIVYLHGEGVMPSGCLGDMKKYCINGKLEKVVGVVMSCTPNALGDMPVTLKDPTSIMGGTIHYKVFKNEDDVTQSLSKSDLF
ncbi:hypothetical protein Tco_0506380 [Tanacetum coccineum]